MLSVWGMFPYSEPDWKSPSVSFCSSLLNIHFTTYTRHQTIITQHITENPLTVCLGHSFIIFHPCCSAECWTTLNGNTSSKFVFLFFFILCLPWNSEITVKDFSKQRVLHIELMQWNMGRHTKPRTKFGSKHWELSLHKKKTLQKDNVLGILYVTEALHYSTLQPAFGCHGFVHLIILAFSYFGFIFLQQVLQPERPKKRKCFLICHFCA